MTPEQIADHIAIEQLVCKYSRAVDRRDYGLLKTLYAENSVDQHGGMFTGSGSEYVEWVSGFLEKSGHTSHQIFNHMIELDPDNPCYAEGEVYTLNVHIVNNATDGQDNVSTGSRYLDKYIKSNLGWQFLHRKTVADYTLVSQVPNGPQVKRMREGAPVGSVKENDPSFGFFSLIKPKV